MVNAYRLGQLTAQPKEFQKMAANNQIKRLVADRFKKEAMGETGEGGSQFFPEGAEEALKPAPAPIGEAAGGLRSKGQGLLNSIKGVSSDIGTKYLGGEAGKGLLKNPHTRTIAALLALLGAGGAGAYALSGGGDKKEV